MNFCVIPSRVRYPEKLTIFLRRRKREKRSADENYVKVFHDRVQGQISETHTDEFNWNPITFWIHFKDLSLGSIDLETTNCAPLQYTVWSRFVTVKKTSHDNDPNIKISMRKKM